MKYALGNMLNGAGGLNADKLALDLRFAADKTLTARKGPTPVFTRASTATFVGSNGLIQSAAINTPRFDHDPLTLACKGLLTEEQRVNSLLRSEDFSTTWTQTQVAILTNATTSPNGLAPADKIVPNLASTISRVSQAFTLTGAHSMSVFAKASEWGWVYVEPISGGVGVWFDLSNGTVGTQSSGFVGSISSFGNGWYRCSVSFTGSGTLQAARFVPTNADNIITTGDGTSGIFLWGAQLEAGAFPTSYIPTTTGPVTRSADTCSITGSAFASFYNPLEGTVVANVVMASGTGVNNQAPFSFSANNLQNIIIPFRGTGGLLNTARLAVLAANVDQTSDMSSYGALNNNVSGKIGNAYGVNNFAASVNGGLVTNSTGTMPAVDRMFIGDRIDGLRTWGGHISSIQYFRKRLPNQKLQTLTT